MVFEVASAPTSKNEFMAWYRRQLESSGGCDYDGTYLSPRALWNWFMEIKEIFIPMNGKFSPSTDTINKTPGLEDRLVDYVFYRDMIHVTVSWDQAEEACVTMMRLAKKHKVGFCGETADDWDIILPNGTTMA